jgi:hypothetical protein
MEIFMATAAFFGLLYLFLYLRGMVWIFSTAGLLARACKVTGVTITVTLGLKFVVARIMFFVASFLNAPLCGFFCVVVSQEVFERDLRKKFAEIITQTTMSDSSFAGTPEQFSELQLYLENNLTM